MTYREDAHQYRENQEDDIDDRFSQEIVASRVHPAFYFLVNNVVLTAHLEGGVAEDSEVRVEAKEKC